MFGQNFALYTLVENYRKHNNFQMILNFAVILLPVKLLTEYTYYKKELYTT